MSDAKEKAKGLVAETNYFLRTAVLGGIVLILGVAGWEVRSYVNEGKAELESRDAKIEDLNNQVSTLKVEHAEQIEAQAQKHANEVAKLNEKHAGEVARLNEEHAAEIAKKDEEISRITTAMRFLKLEHRLARIDVLEQKADEGDPTRVRTTLRFVELGNDGKPVSEPIVGTVMGREIYIDAPTIQFKDKFVEEGDLLRGRSICRFRRVYGDQQAPQDGISLEHPNASPGDMSDFERELWGKFWDLANNPEHVSVKSAQGGGPSIVPKPGMRYFLDLRASGGLSIKPDRMEE